MEMEVLAYAFANNPDIQEMVESDYTLIVLNSSTYQNFFDRVLNALADKPKAMRPIYSSTNKIQAFEDCITFIPHLFRLSKSIIVAEPLATFGKSIRDRMGARNKATKAEENTVFREIKT